MGLAAALPVIAGGGGRLSERECGGGLAYPGLDRGARVEPASPASPRTCWMAAQAAAREAGGFREVPTLCLAPDAGPEAVGLVEYEEEDEDEEVAAARRARSFAQDARVRFVGGRLEQMLGLPEEKWSQHLESEDKRQVLGEFLESPSPACLVFSVDAVERLAASQQVRGDGRGNQVTPPAQPDGHLSGTGQLCFLGFFRGTYAGALKNFNQVPAESPQNPPRVPTLLLSGCWLVF